MGINSERRIFSKVFGLIIFGAVIVFLNSQNYLDPVKNTLARFVLVGSGGARGGTQNVKDYVSAIFKVNQLKEENKNLKNLDLRIKELEESNKEISLENFQLREELNLLPKKEFNLLGAEVIASDPSLSDEMIIINRGEKDGVKSGMPVIIKDKILIGKVHEVQPTKSKVILTVTPSADSSFSAALAENQVVGIAEGRYNLEIVLRLIPNQTEVKEKELVVTANNNPKYPPNLLVGEVINVEKTPDGLFQQAVVKPFYSVNNLRFVSIIK